jgi:hypothetical protein
MSALLLSVEIRTKACISAESDVLINVTQNTIIVHTSYIDQWMPYNDKPTTNASRSPTDGRCQSYFLLRALRALHAQLRRPAGQPLPYFTEFCPPAAHCRQTPEPLWNVSPPMRVCAEKSTRATFCAPKNSRRIPVIGVDICSCRGDRLSGQNVHCISAELASCLLFATTCIGPKTCEAYTFEDARNCR